MGLSERKVLYSRQARDDKSVSIPHNFSMAFLEDSEEMWRGGVGKRNALLCLWGVDGELGASESAFLPP